MNCEKQSAEITMFSATKVDFDYTIKIQELSNLKGSGSVLIKELSPSLEKIKETVEAYVAEKAVAHLEKSGEISIDISIVITNTSKITTKVNITHRTA